MLCKGANLAIRLNQFHRVRLHRAIRNLHARRPDRHPRQHQALRLRAFNDRYGVRRGDRLLAHVAAVLRTLATEEPGSFLAHYGADDFGFLLPPERVVETTRRAVQGIGATVGEFYDPEDLSAGGIAGHDARGGAILVAPKAQRIGRNPKTGIEVPILPRRVMTFRASQSMRARVAGK